MSGGQGWLSRDGLALRRGDRGFRTTDKGTHQSQCCTSVYNLANVGRPKGFSFRVDRGRREETRARAEEGESGTSMMVYQRIVSLNHTPYTLARPRAGPVPSPGQAPIRRPNIRKGAFRARLRPLDPGARGKTWLSRDCPVTATTCPGRRGE